MFNKLFEMIKNTNKVILAPHKDIDLDALGSALGLYEIISNLNKEVYINIEEKTYELGVKRALETIKTLNINFSNMDKIKIEENDLIIIIDHNKKELIQNKEILKLSNNIAIIDHHIEGKDSFVNEKYKFINPDISSTSEIITKMLEKLELKVNKKIANILLAGITIDTNNFTIKTSAETHNAASFLNLMGANSQDVQYLLKEDLKDYINMQKTIFKTEILKGKYAIACASKSEIYEKEQLSKIADSLLSFDNIEASFAIGRINNNIIGISARSLGNIDVERIMENLSGGGNKEYAACMLYNTTIEKSKEKLISTISGGK